MQNVFTKEDDERFEAFRKKAITALDAKKPAAKYDPIQDAAELRAKRAANG